MQKLKGKCEFCEKEGVDIHHLQPQEDSILMILLKHFIKTI